MTLISEHVEPDTRERILVVAERLFRQIGYQKTTVADIAKELRMSPANVYRFFDSKKSIHEGVARVLMGEVEIEARRLSRVLPDGRKVTVAQMDGGPNGAALGPDGMIYVTNNGPELHQVLLVFDGLGTRATLFLADGTTQFVPPSGSP